MGGGNKHFQSDTVIGTISVDNLQWIAHLYGYKMRSGGLRHFLLSREQNVRINARPRWACFKPRLCIFTLLKPGLWSPSSPTLSLSLMHSAFLSRFMHYALLVFWLLLIGAVIRPSKSWNVQIAGWKTAVLDTWCPQDAQCSTTFQSWVTSKRKGILTSTV